MIGTIIITLPASIPLGMWTAKQRIPVWLIPFMGFALGIVIGQLNP